ncbi:hypothetical protein FisN_13Hu193 [Fistulifera solaris]|uniref:Uncharacterized protein n=1 Tax=Fistulifera solaris TaxID=1519565 RepID=A0A1Z5KMZ7_FISSO|nr:hypothetical protein FisN_13Hu193 [Fistulifera solaris]|eukprot:GAX27710.1 hypothetical protein FisN_13Hu193 [Fistulifera solaris]
MSSSWFQWMPPEALDDDQSTLMTQLAATKWSSKIQFYRKLRSPRSVEDLLKFTKANHLVWMKSDSFIVLKKLPKSVPFFSKFRKAGASIDFEQKTVHVYGTSEKAVMKTLIRLLCLEDGRVAEVRLGDHFSPAVDPLVPTKFLGPGFLQKYIEANPQRRLVFGRGCYLSKNQSMRLASHPNPLNVGIECLFEDGGRAFLDTLSQRTTSFGTLASHSPCFDSSYDNYSSTKVFLEVMSHVSNISLELSKCIMDHSRVLLPLSAKAQRVEYRICCVSGFDSIGALTISPEAVVVIFDDHAPAPFHTEFLRASGNLREMGLIYDASRPPSEAQRSELLSAISSNQNLHRLELGCFFALEDFWHELLETIWSHGSLRRVVFWLREDSIPLYQMETLLVYLDKYDHIDLIIKCRNASRDVENMMNDFIEPFRLENRARVLTREPDPTRPAVVGAALVDWAGGEFDKTYHLLSANTDLLCSLIDLPAPQRRGKRQRDELY